MRIEEIVVETTKGAVKASKKKNLIGLTIGNRKVTANTPNEHWDGDFNCHNNGLTSLQGAPQSVGGGFYCSENKLASLQGAPRSVSGGFYCSENKLASLHGAPQSVGGIFSCSSNKLASLEGAPQSVGGIFNCYDNNLTSLEGAPRSVGKNFYCNSNKLTSLQGVPHSVGGNFYCHNNPVKTGLIHLFRANIKGKIITKIHPEIDQVLNTINQMQLNPNQKIAKFMAEIFKLAQRHNRPEWKDFVKP